MICKHLSFGAKHAAGKETEIATRWKSVKNYVFCAKSGWNRYPSIGPCIDRPDFWWLPSNWLVIVWTQWPNSGPCIGRSMFTSSSRFQSRWAQQYLWLTYDKWSGNKCFWSGYLIERVYFGCTCIRSNAQQISFQPPL